MELGKCMFCGGEDLTQEYFTTESGVIRCNKCGKEIMFRHIPYDVYQRSYHAHGKIVVRKVDDGREENCERGELRWEN